MNRKLLAACLASFLAVSGCVAPAKRLDDYLKAGRYAEARALLEEEKVGLAPAPTAPAKAVELRTRYTEELDSVSAETVDRLVAGGAAHDAQAKAREFQGLCPWSERIRKLAERCDRMVERIAAAETGWRNVLGTGVAPAAEARRFLAEIASERPWILDSERMRAYEATAVRAVVAEWAASLAKEPVRQAQAAEAICGDLAKAGVAAADIDELRLVLKIRSMLPGAPGARLSDAQLAALGEARKALGADGVYECTTRLAPCLEAVWRSFERWQSDVHAGILADQQVTYGELADAESWLAVARHGDALRPGCARAHARMAQRRAPQGTASALALLHAIRAQALGLSADDPELVAARTLAEATWSATPAPVFRLDIELQPKVDPEIRGLVLSVLAGEMTETPGAWSRMDPLSLDADAPRVVLGVRDAVLVADFSDLHAVQSSYFSHFETVANPQKSYLESRLESAKRDVSYKESAYNSAVSSHNIWPTQYSLNNVNWAYSAYSAAVDNHNSLVWQYNATPATISQPVYLPYTFKQGRIRFGWTLDTTVAIGAAAKIEAARESVLTDFVRLGNKPTDQNESFRGFDGLDIDTSADAGLGHLYKTVALVKEAMNPGLARLAIEPIADLAPDESAVLGWLYHPWGRQPDLALQLGLPEWARITAPALQLKREPPSPPSRRLASPPEAVQGPLTSETAAAALAKYVCLTVSAGPAGGSTGTATLVGPEGLVLTCAHVLSGNKLTLDFPAGPWRGAYEGELLFVNTERDVALVRAKGLVNDTWAEVRLDQPSRAGEAIIAIGNPAMDVGGLNRGGVSSGIVSNPELNRGSTQFLSADIAVASGSSGGPLFSLKDGKLVGVVQRVATSPGIPSTQGEVAATGFLCLAAAAPSLRKWLGLEVAGD